jgi:hypothetical protein
MDCIDGSSDSVIRRDTALILLSLLRERHERQGALTKRCSFHQSISFLPSILQRYLGRVRPLLSSATATGQCRRLYICS